MQYLFIKQFPKHPTPDNRNRQKVNKHRNVYLILRLTCVFIVNLAPRLTNWSRQNEFL